MSSDYSSDDQEIQNSVDQQKIFTRGQYPRPFPRYLRPAGSYALCSISIRAFCLGLGCAFGLQLAWIIRDYYLQLPLFFSALAVFHFLEFYITATYNPARAKVEAFILTNNGAAYTIAHTSALIEGLLEWFLVPEWKSHRIATVLGCILVTLGQVLRSLAMAHAGHNFSHYLVERRERSHVLVTSGIYGFIRHPSYFGYYCWAIGTQLMLGNPVCTMGFAVFLWRFFKNRIEDEEAHLVSFFGNDYLNYKKHSWSGIPLVAGFQ